MNPRAELVAGSVELRLARTVYLARAGSPRAAVAAIESRELDPHDLICAVKLAESANVPEQYRQRVRPVVVQRAQEIVAREPEQWREYNPQPLWFVSGPRSLLAEPLADILSANLDFLAENQTAEGCWAPNWNWGDFYADTWPQAQQDASSRLTLQALRQLDAFGRSRALAYTNLQEPTRERETHMAAERLSDIISNDHEAAARAQGAALEDLQRIPGVGKAVARDLWNLGFRSVDQLRGQDPQALYDRLCALQGGHVDRCMLYTFRCAVYFASTQLPEPELLKWWNWKDRP